MLLTIIAGTGLPMSPNRTPTSHYVHVSTPYGQYNTRAIQAVMADCSVSWNQTLNIHERPQTFFKRLMSIFKSKAVHLEIRALYELDQYEVVCAFDTTFEQLLAEHTLHSDDNNQRISLKLKAGDTNESVVNGQPASSRKYDQTHTREKNVVIFGETGSGKSSIINVVAQEQIAKTSNDAPGCTSEFKRYSVDISGQKFALFDTAGLNEGSAGTVPHKRAKKQLKGLLNKLMSHKSPSGGIDLLVYCVQNTAAPRAILNTYNTVYSGTCRKKRVPVVVVVTGLESMSPMESWWDTHKEIFNSMDLAGHACVMTVQEYPDIPEEYIHRVAQSSKILRDLVMNTASAADDNLPAGTWCWSPSWSMA
jgi:GTP-binding protein EngB required for normal cell division